MLKLSQPRDHTSQLDPGEVDGEQALSSTPTKLSANFRNVSEKVSLVMKQNHCEWVWSVWVWLYMELTAGAGILTDVGIVLVVRVWF